MKSCVPTKLGVWWVQKVQTGIVLDHRRGWVLLECHAWKCHHYAMAMTSKECHALATLFQAVSCFISKNNNYGRLEGHHDQREFRICWSKFWESVIVGVVVFSWILNRRGDASSVRFGSGIIACFSCNLNVQRRPQGLPEDEKWRPGDEVEPNQNFILLHQNFGS